MQGMPKKLHKSPNARWKILTAGLYRAAKNIHMPLHQHNHWELVYYRSGTVDCLVEDKKRPGHTALFWLTPPGVNHGELALTAYSCYWIALDNSARGDRPLFFDDDANEAMGRVCQQIAVEWGGKSAGRERMLELLSEQMGCLLDRAQSEETLSLAEQTVLRAERWIEEQGGQPLSIQEVAREVGVSSSSLRNYFNSVRHVSPRAHVLQVRLDKAIRFLRTSSHKLETIAELCGYDSASHLTRHVKKFSGMTPGHMRRLS
jgi:AraC-like DNA-binding protein